MVFLTNLFDKLCLFEINCSFILDKNKFFFLSIKSETFKNDIFKSLISENNLLINEPIFSKQLVAKYSISFTYPFLINNSYNSKFGDLFGEKKSFSLITKSLILLKIVTKNFLLLEHDFIKKYIPFSFKYYKLYIK